MAAFDPQFEVQPNSYLNLSKPISKPEYLADTSAGQNLKTLGTALEGGAELADATVKDVIKDNIYQKVDAERDAFSAALTNTKNFGDPRGPVAQQDNSPSAVGDTGPNKAPTDLLAQNTVSVPTAIDNGIGKIGSVQNALDGNKISETTYYQRLNSIAKDMRATYPGYRDYIDQEISKITGGNPANEYVKSIIGDINRSATQGSKERDYWRDQIVNNKGFPGADRMLQQYEQDGNHARVMQWLADNQGRLDYLNLKKAVAQSADQDRSTTQQNVEDYANAAAGHAATIGFYNRDKYGTGGLSPQQIHDQLMDMTLHPEKSNDVVAQQLSQQYQAMKAQAYQETMLMMHTSKTADGRSFADALGPDKTKALVDKTISGLYDATTNLIQDKQFGPAYMLQNAATATVNNATWTVLSDPTIGGRVTTAGVFNKVAPNLAPVIFGKQLSSGLDTDTNNFLQEQKKQAVAQTGGNYRGADGNMYTFTQSLDELKKYGAIAKQDPSRMGPAFNSLLDVTKAITSPQSTDEAKHNAIKYFYDPHNIGVMNQFMDDYYDPSKQGMVRGRSSAFATLTSPDITKSVWDYGQGHPADWLNYSNWAKTEFATQFRETIADLNDTKDFGGQYNLAWNNEKHEFKLLDEKGGDVQGLAASVLNYPYRVVQNINMGLKNVANIAKQEGTNVDAYLFKALADGGYSPKKEVDGVPAQIMQAILLANGSRFKVNPPISK